MKTPAQKQPNNSNQVADNLGTMLEVVLWPLYVDAYTRVNIQTYMCTCTLLNTLTHDIWETRKRKQIRVRCRNTNCSASASLRGLDSMSHFLSGALAQLKFPAPLKHRSFQVFLLHGTGPWGLSSERQCTFQAEPLTEEVTSNCFLDDGVIVTRNNSSRLSQYSRALLKCQNLLVRLVNLFTGLASLQLSTCLTPHLPRDSKRAIGAGDQMSSLIFFQGAGFLF